MSFTHIRLTTTILALIILGTAITGCPASNPDPNPSRSYATVPDCAGMTQAAAEAAIGAAGLDVGAITEEYSDTANAGIVIDQSPTPFQQVLSGSSVDLVVSKGSRPVDVLSVTPTAAPPGTILKVEMTVHDDSASYEVLFGGVIVPPMRFDEGSFTVMVPPIDKGICALAIRAAGASTTGQSKPFEVEEPLPTTGAEAEQLVADIGAIIAISEDYTTPAFEMLGAGPADMAALKDGFADCARILTAATQQLRLLDPDDKELLCQMIVASGFGEETKNLVTQLNHEKDLSYHLLLAQKDLPGFSQTAFFLDMVRLDMLSAVLTDALSVMKAVKYGSLAAAVSGYGAAATAGIWTVVTPLEPPIKAVDAILDGVVPTDLKTVQLLVTPDQGVLLNPGETATVRAIGRFGTQTPLAQEVLDLTVDFLMGTFSKEIRGFLDKLPGVTTDLRRNLDKEVLDTAAEVFISAGFGIEDHFLGFLDSTLNYSFPWTNEVILDPAYYELRPEARLSVQALHPLLGETLVRALDAVLMSILGEDGAFFTNDPIWTDNETIAAYDPYTATLAANASGTTYLHFRPYRFDEIEVPVLTWFFPIEGWHYLEEGVADTPPGESTLIINEALPIQVTGSSDPVDSPLEDTVISGVVPGIFTTDGGSFEISVSPVDENGDLLYDNVTVDSFSFSPIRVTTVNDPNTLVATGSASPDAIDIVPPGTPGAGVSVAILLDSSGSMSVNDPDDDRVTAAKGLIDHLRLQDTAAVLDFGTGNDSGFSRTRLLQGFTHDRGLLYQAVDQVRSSGGTPMYTSLSETLDYISGSGVPNPSLMVLTDGEASDDDLFQTVVDKAIDKGIALFVVGLGSDVDFTQLQALASQTNGTFASASESGELQELFENIGIAASAGRIVVYASGGFVPSLPGVGSYSISGELKTRISGLTIPTPFNFAVDVVSLNEGKILKALASE